MVKLGLISKISVLNCFYFVVVIVYLWVKFLIYYCKDNRMSLSVVFVGKNLFDEVNVIIEILVYVDLVKYEVDKDMGVMFVDCFMVMCMYYLINYGYVNNILLEDGDLVDVFVMMLFFLLVGFVIKCCFVGVLNMMDEFGKDVKIFVVLVDKFFIIYCDVYEIVDVFLLFFK